jgi:hypothetical protein
MCEKLLNLAEEFGVFFMKIIKRKPLSGQAN